jgi:hypothetical protein
MHMCAAPASRPSPPSWTPSGPAPRGPARHGEFNHMIVNLPDFLGGTSSTNRQVATLASVPFGLGGEPRSSSIQRPPHREIPEYRVEGQPRQRLARHGAPKCRTCSSTSAWKLSDTSLSAPQPVPDVTEREYPLTLSDATDCASSTRRARRLGRTWRIASCRSSSVFLRAARTVPPVGGLLTGRAPDMGAVEAEPTPTRRTAAHHRQRLPGRSKPARNSICPRDTTSRRPCSVAPATSTPYLPRFPPKEQRRGLVELRSSLRTHRASFRRDGGRCAPPCLRQRDAAVQHPIALERVAPNLGPHVAPPQPKFVENNTVLILQRGRGSSI